MGLSLPRDVATGERGGDMAPPPPPTSLQLQSKKVQQFQFQTSGIRDIAFCWCSEITRTKHFTIFTVYTTIFWQFTVAFFKPYRRNRSRYVGPNEKVRY